MRVRRILPACLFAAAAGILLAERPVLAGAAWEKLASPVADVSLFDAAIANVQECGGRLHVFTAGSLWTDDGGGFLRKDLPTTRPLTQAPICFDGGIWLTASDGAGGREAFYGKDGSSWENLTAPASIYDPCCGKFVAAGNRLYQFFRKEIHLLATAPSVRPWVWENLGLLSPDTLLSVFASEAGVLAQLEGAHPVLRFRGTKGSAWSEPALDSMPGIAFRLLGLDDSLAMFDVSTRELQDNTQPGIQLYRPSRICFQNLQDGRRTCPASLDRSLPLQTAVHLAKGRYAFRFLQVIRRGFIEERFLYDASRDSLLAFRDFRGLYGAASGAIYFTDGSNLFLSRDEGRTLEFIATRKSAVGVLESFEHKGRLYAQGSKGGWFRADLQALEGPDSLAWTAVPGMASLAAVSSDGGHLFGVHRGRIDPYYVLPTPVISLDDGATWINYGKTYQDSLGSGESNYPVRDFLSCVETAYRLQDESFFERPVMHLLFKGGRDTSFREIRFWTDVWNKQVTALACEGDNLLFTLKGEGLFRFEPGRIAVSKVSVLPGLADPASMVVADGRLFLASSGKLHSARLADLEFLPVADAPISGTFSLHRMGGFLVAAGGEGIWRVPLNSLATRPGTPFRPGILPVLPSAAPYRPWFRYGTSWFAPDGRALPVR